MKRIAFIDLGSNSVRFIVIDNNDDGSHQMIYQGKETIRLSQGMWEHQKLTQAAMDRAIKALQGFAHMADVMEVDSVYAVATAAVRLAHNQKDFINRVEKETGFVLHCISGQEEARLGFLGIINTLSLSDFVSFDLGGASTEVSLVRNRQLVQSVSLPVGAVTLNGRFPTDGVVDSKTLSRMMAHIETIIEDYPWLKDVRLPLVGIGGTARNLAKMDQRAHNYPIDKVHNYPLSRERVKELFHMVRSKTVNQRRKIPGLSTDRADIIVAGTVIIESLMRFSKAKCLLVGGSGLREGLFYDYYGQAYGKNPIMDDILAYSADNIFLRLGVAERKHALYVRAIAIRLFDLWKKALNLPEWSKRLLALAALLHDAGKRINYYSHAKHGGYLFVNSNIYGLSHKEQAMVALMIMNSHGIATKNYRNFSYAKLLSSEEKNLMQCLSLILALGEGLDITHEELVEDLSSKIKDKDLILQVYVKAGANTMPAQATIEKLSKSFKKECKRNLLFSWRQIH